MAASREHSSRPTPKRIRRLPKNKDVDSNVFRAPQADSVPGRSSTDGFLAGEVAKTMKLAVDELSQDDLKSLEDPSFREQAARWRSGTGSRRISAALARCMNSLYSIKPGWASQAKPCDADAPLAEPMPLRGEAPSRFWTWYRSLSPWFHRIMAYWKTVWLLVLLLLFPKLAAALVALVVRLVVRFSVAVFFRVVHELWQELDDVLGHLGTITTGMEHALVQYVEALVTGGPPAPPPLLTAPVPVASDNTGAGQPPPPAPTPATSGDPPLAVAQLGRAASWPLGRWDGSSVSFERKLTSLIQPP